MVSVKLLSLYSLSFSFAVFAAPSVYEEYVSKRETTFGDYKLPEYAHTSYNYCEASFPEPSKYAPVANSTLAFVQVLIRHGGRAPAYVIPKLNTTWFDCNYPLNYITNKDSDTSDSIDFVSMKQTILTPSTEDQSNCSFAFWKGNCANGQLLDVGKKNLKEIGKALRHIYVDKLGYLNNTLQRNSSINVRTTSIWRTQDSAASLLTGVYPENKRVNKASITMGYLPIEIETMFENTGACPKISALYGESMKAEIYREYLKANYAAMSRIANITGVDISSSTFSTQWGPYMDILQTHRCNAKKYPCDINGNCLSETDALLAMDNSHFEAAYFRRDWAKAFEFIQLVGGSLINDMLKDISDGIAFDQKNPNSKPGTRRFSLFSAHDATLSTILGAMRASDKDMLWPPYSANMIFEVWRNNDSNIYSIRVLNNGQTLSVLGMNGTKTPWCDFNSCKWSDYKAFMSKYIVTDLQAACFVK